MERSFFNYIIKNPEYDNYLIYNSYSNSLIETENKIAEMLISDEELDIANDIINAEKFKTLYEGEFICDNSEAQKIKAKEKSLDIFNYGHSSGLKTLSIQIASTLACNFRCIYCYEGNEVKIDKNKKVMNKNTQSQIMDWIKKSIVEDGIKKVSLGWYGGEPLLNMKLITDFSKRVKELCDFHEIEYKATTIITNGYFLTPSNVKKLLEIGIHSAQVTIDGPEDIHNSRRPSYGENNDSFETIIRNLKSLDKEFTVHLRINVDSSNKSTHFDLVKKLEENGVWPLRNINYIYLGQINPPSADYPFERLLTKEYLSLSLDFRFWMLEEFNKLVDGNRGKLQFSYPSRINSLPCSYNLYPNTWVINPDGGVYRCWEAVGNPSLKVGTVDEFINDKKSVLDRTNKWFISEELRSEIGCYECKAFPICGIKCPYEICAGIELTERVCSDWKYYLEETLLKQYNFYKKNPDLVKGFPKNGEVDENCIKENLNVC